MGVGDIIGRRLRAIAIVALMAAAVPAGAAESAPAEAGATLAEAQRLIGAGKAEDAWALLSPHEAEWAGTPAYDYLLGVAALDSGRASDAVFSLERVLAAQPEYDGARMELARALYEAGDPEGARAQFAYLATRAPPAEASRVIDSYIVAIDQRGGVRHQRWSAFLGTDAGYDSNANGSTADAQFLGLTLDPDNIETDSPYVTLSGGVEHNAGFSNGLASASSLRFDWRDNPDAHFVDQAVASAATALFWTAGAWRLNGGASGYYGWLDGSPQESYVGLNAGVARLLGDRWELGARVQGGPLRYHDEQLHVLDVNRYLGALTLTRYGLFGPGGRAGFSLIGGTDDAQNDSPSSDYSNDKLGARVNAEVPVGQSARLYVEAAWLGSDYADSPGFFGTDRQDDQYSVLLAADFNRWPGDGWTVSPHLRYVRNDSNVALYEYDRWEAGVSLRLSFRGAP